MAVTLLVASFRRSSTGPEPAAGRAVRSALSAWNGARRGLEVTHLDLPRSYARASNELVAELVATRPDILLLLDTDDTSSEWLIEALAANLDDSPEPDEDGALRLDTIIDAEGPVAYRSKLPVDGIYDKFIVERVPARVSHKAGGHVLNHVYYKAMRAIAQEELATLAGAVRSPPDTTPTGADVEARSLADLTEETTMLLAVLAKLYPAALAEKRRPAD